MAALLITRAKLLVLDNNNVINYCKNQHPNTYGSAKTPDGIGIQFDKKFLETELCNQTVTKQMMSLGQ